MPQRKHLEGERNGNGYVRTGTLIISSWAESSALLFVASAEQPGDVLGRFFITEATDDGVRLEAANGITRLRLDLSSFETTCSYFEPREFSEREDSKHWVSTLSESEKLTSGLSFSFFVRYQGPPPMEDLLVPVGTIVLFDTRTLFGIGS
jgi:hypothetical protein